MHAVLQLVQALDQACTCTAAPVSDLTGMHQQCAFTGMAGHLHCNRCPGCYVAGRALHSATATLAADTSVAGHAL